MSSAIEGITLSALFVDDDEEIVEQCRSLLPDSIDHHTVSWTFVSSFEEATKLLSEARFDVVVTDVYKGRKLSGKANVSAADNHAKAIVEAVKSLGFSLIVLYSDGPRPDDLLTSPSIRFVDKSVTSPPFPEPVIEILSELIETRGKSLEVVHKIRSELDREAGSYIWSFIDENWDTLNKDPEFGVSGLERLIRRRAAIQMNERLHLGGIEPRADADKYDYYIWPSLPGPLRLGTILKSNTEEKYFVVLTPHCHLVPNGRDGDGKEKAPRADMVLLSECLFARDLVRATKVSNKHGFLRIPAIVGSPEGRYCFLPGFASLPDLLSDLMRLSSVPYVDISRNFQRIAVLDSPFAEAVQSSLARFYANVGHRNLAERDFAPIFGAEEKILAKAGGQI